MRELAGGGTWGIISGQPTDDSEMALSLARMLVERGTYDPDAALGAYRDWLNSGPFDCGGTILGALHGRPNHDSQANGAMMRISPLGIFGANYDFKQVSKWAMQDAFLTHPHPVCCQANALFAMAISRAISTGQKPKDLYHEILTWVKDMEVNQSLMSAIQNAESIPPKSYIQHQGWVLIAFQNALWQLLHAPNLEEGVVDTIMRGGDTDTNAAICGALLGAVYGREAIPPQWINCLLNCRPKEGKPHVEHPRPKDFWPVDALELAKKLLTCGASTA